MNDSKDVVSNISMILATTEYKGAYGIGLNGKMAWYIPEDLKHFKEYTVGKTVVMGRKTFLSLPKKFQENGGFPDRDNIVLTRNTDFKISRNTKIVNSMDEIIELANLNQDREYVIIGGSSLFNYFFEISKEIIWTVVWTRDDSEIECDVFLDDNIYKKYFESSTCNDGSPSFYNNDKYHWIINKYKNPRF